MCTPSLSRLHLVLPLYIGCNTLNPKPGSNLGLGPKMGSELGRSPLNLIYRGLVGIRAFGYMGSSVEGLLGLGAFGYMPDIPF
jgi:hypothetical protein